MSKWYQLVGTGRYDHKKIFPNQDIRDLVGEVIKEVIGGEKGSDECRIVTESGKLFKIYHDQDCCETVDIEDCEMDDVIGGYVHFADFVNDKEPYKGSDSYTWSFLKIETSKGSIRQRWLGESNGYYSEEVSVSCDIIANSIIHRMITL